MASLSLKFLAHAAMLFVGISFGGLNVLLGKAFAFNSNSSSNSSSSNHSPPPPHHHMYSHHEEYCRMSAFVLYRQAGGLVLLGLCVLMFEPRPLLHKPLGLKGMLLLAAQGFTGMFMGQGFFVLGLGHTNPVVAAVFQPLSPCVVVIFAVLLRMEVITWRKSLGFLIGVGGAVVMVWPSFKASSDPGDATEGDAIGVVLLSAGVLGGAAYLLLMKKSYRYCSPLTMSALQYSVSLACMLIAFSAPCFEWKWGSAFERPGIDDTITWVAVVYAVVIASALNYFLMAWSNKHLEASTIGLYGLTQIFSTPIISYIASKTEVSNREFVGAAMVCASLLIVNWQQRIDDRRVAAREKDEQMADEPLLRGRSIQVE